MKRSTRLTLVLVLVVLLVTLGCGFPLAALAETLTVSTPDDSLADDGSCSLREAIEFADQAPFNDDCSAKATADLENTILFAPALVGATIVVTPALTIGNPENSGNVLTIRGNVPITISGGGVSRIFTITGYTSTVTLDSLTLTRGNTGTGGAIFFDSDTGGSTLNVNNSRVFSNTASFSGGAIHIGFAGIDAALNVNNSVLDDNTAGSDGGVIYNTGNLTITNSTLTGNTADGDGGAIFNIGGVLNVVNSTLSGNRAAGDGGAVENINPERFTFLSLRNSTVVSNTAESGGGIGNRFGGVELESSIVAGNINDDCFDSSFFAQDVISLGHNLFSNPSNCPITATDTITVFGNILLDPVLADNGGPTATHALLPGSPAIDHGGGCPPPAADQRGVPRPFGRACDSGAYEAVQAGLVATKTVGTIPTACGSTSSLAAEGGDDLYYCVTVENTGNITFTNLTIRDPQLGIDTTLAASVAPGALLQVTSTTIPSLTVRAELDTTNVVTVTAATDPVAEIGILSATASASATVVVTPTYTVTLSEPLPPHPVGFTQTVVATVVDHLNRPGAGLPVIFKVEGANPQQRTVATDSSGAATFSYTGLNNATLADGISATLGANPSGSSPSDQVAAVWRKIRVDVRGEGVGDSKAVTRTVTASVSTDDAQREAVPGLQVGFTVFGGTLVDPEFKDTDAQGQTQFQYVSLAPQASAAQASSVQVSSVQATDIISVWVDLDRNLAYIAAEPNAMAEVLTVVVLAEFGAYWTAGDVLLAWRTAVEVDNAGFNLYRAGRAEGPYARINEQLIGARGSGAGASYAFIDRQPGSGPFFYRLEDIDTAGVSTFHDPLEVDAVGATGSLPNRLYLPLIGQ